METTTDINVGKRGQGAPALPKELKRTKHVPVRLSDDEKKVLAAFSDRRGWKMARVLRDAVRDYIASGEVPGDELRRPEKHTRAHMVFVSMTPVERSTFDGFIDHHKVVVSMTVRYAIKRYIEKHS